MFAKIILLSLFSISAHAQITALTAYSGNGCPQGSISSTTTDDGSIISVLFDSFTAATTAQNKYVSSQCTMNIAVSIPEGMRISTAQSVQNAFYSVPKGSWGRMMTELYVRGSNGRGIMNTYNYRDFSNGFQDNVTLNTNAQAAASTNCSERQQILQIRSSIYLWTAPHQNEYASGMIDSVDLTLNAKTPSMYSVIFEKCPVSKPPKKPVPRWPWLRKQLQ